VSRYSGEEAPPAPGTTNADLSTFKRKDTRTDPAPKQLPTCPEETVEWPTSETVNRRSKAKGY
jgi:hypothetical protein